MINEEKPLWVPVGEMISAGTIGSALVYQTADLAERLRPETTFNQPIMAIFGVRTGSIPQYIIRELGRINILTVKDAINLPEKELSSSTIARVLAAPLEAYLKEWLKTPHGRLLAKVLHQEQHPLPPDREQELIMVVEETMDQTLGGYFPADYKELRIQILQRRFGLRDGITRSMEQTAQELGMPDRRWSYQMEQTALKRLKETKLRGYQSLPEDSNEKLVLGAVFVKEILPALQKNVPPSKVNPALDFLKLIGWVQQPADWLKESLDGDFLPEGLMDQLRQDEIGSISVDDLGFSPHVLGILRRRYIYKVGDLTLLTRRDLIESRNFGILSAYDLGRGLQKILNLPVDYPPDLIGKILIYSFRDTSKWNRITVGEAAKIGAEINEAFVGRI